MGFRGTFTGTLKENFDRMMNPRKFLNELDESNINEDGFDKDGNPYGFDHPESEVTKFEVGDLVFDKSVGQYGLVALVTSVEGGNTELYYRGYNGDRETLSSDELDDIVDAYPKFIDILVNNGDISAYASISKKLGITLNPKYERAALEYENDDESYSADQNMDEVAMPNLTENYNRIQILNKKLSNKNLNEAGFDSSEEGYGDDPIDSRPKKDDVVYLKTPYSNVASRIMYIDSTHVYWKTDSTDQIDTGSKGGVYHIGQLRDKQLYNDLLTWMDTGDKTALETKQYTDI